MNIFTLLQELREKEPLTPDERAKKFLKKLQSYKIGDFIELDGFLLLSKPPNPPAHGVYYLLSPLSPSEIKASTIKTYVILKFKETTKIIGKLESGSYVTVSGILEAYHYGNMRMIIVDKIETENYLKYWTDYKEYSLNKREISEMFSNTFYSDAGIIDSLIYSLFSSPNIANFEWNGNFIFGSLTLERSEKVLKSVIGAFSYIYRLLPKEFRLRAKREKFPYIDDDMDIDFLLTYPESSYKIYASTSKRYLNSDIPLPKWTLKHFKNRDAIFLIPKPSKISPKDFLAYSSETPWILREPIGVEQNREFEQLFPNLLVTVLTSQMKLGTLLEPPQEFRYSYINFIEKARQEHGEIIDALLSKGMLFEVNRRYLLTADLFGAMTRFEGKMEKSAIKESIWLTEEILDRWINELSGEAKLKLLKEYRDFMPKKARRAEQALKIFEDLEATSPKGEVLEEEFYNALVKFGFSSKQSRELIERLKAEGFLLEPRKGVLKLIRL